MKHFKLGTYILNDDHEPVLCEDILIWGEWMGATKRSVAQDDRGGILVSTVFLGLDHSPGLWLSINSDDHIPVLFETMVFGGPLDMSQERYATWDEAAAGHREWVARVFPPVEYVH